MSEISIKKVVVVYERLAYNEYIENRTVNKPSLNLRRK